MEFKKHYNEITVRFMFFVINIFNVFDNFVLFQQLSVLCHFHT